MIMIIMFGNFVIFRNDFYSAIIKKMGKILLQSESEFATTAVLLSRPLPADAKGLYYEVTVRTGGLAQIGWAYAGSGSAVRGTKFDASADLTSLRMFRPNSDTGDGVGDVTS